MIEFHVRAIVRRSNADSALPMTLSGFVHSGRLNGFGVKYSSQTLDQSSLRLTLTYSSDTGSTHVHAD